MSPSIVSISLPVDDYVDVYRVSVDVYVAVYRVSVVLSGLGDQGLQPAKGECQKQTNNQKKRKTYKENKP
ncbi:hypothetical protein MaudCBS49596_001729, partial [Microsporum audouinii]